MSRKTLSHTISCFFDEGKIKEFELFYSSVKNIYDNFKIIASINFDASFLDAGIINDARVTLNPISIDQLEIFNKKYTPVHINSIMSYGRLLIPYLEIFDTENKIIYFDVDILLSRELDEKYLNQSENFAFATIPNNNDENSIRYEYSKFRESIHARNELSEKEMSISKDIITLIKNANYFNSGVLIINSVEKYRKLTNKFFQIENASNNKFSDQDLLNYYNTNEIKIVSDQSMNYLVYLSALIEVENPIVYHFAGNQKQKSKMREIVKSNFDFGILRKKDSRSLSKIITEDILKRI